MNEFLVIFSLGTLTSSVLAGVKASVWRYKATRAERLLKEACDKHKSEVAHFEMCLKAERQRVADMAMERLKLVDQVRQMSER